MAREEFEVGALGASEGVYLPLRFAPASRTAEEAAFEGACYPAGETRGVLAGVFDEAGLQTDGAALRAPESVLHARILGGHAGATCQGRAPGAHPVGVDAPARSASLPPGGALVSFGSARLRGFENRAPADVSTVLT